MPPDRQPLRAPNSYNYPSTSTSSTYRTSNPSTFSSTTTNHRPKHPIGASPADIAPPISLRRNNNNNNNNKVSRFGNLGTTNRGETTTTTSGKSKLRGGTEQEKDKNGKDQSANGRGNDVVVGKSGTGVTTSSASTSNSSSSTSQSKTKSTATTSKTTMNEDPEILIIDTSPMKPSTIASTSTTRPSTTTTIQSNGKGKGKEKELPKKIVQMIPTGPKADLKGKGKAIESTNSDEGNHTTSLEGVRRKGVLIVPRMPIAQVKAEEEERVERMKKEKEKERRGKGKERAREGSSGERDRARSRDGSEEEGGGGRGGRRRKRRTRRNREGDWRGDRGRDRGRGPRGGGGGGDLYRTSYGRHARNSLLKLGDLTSWVLVDDAAVELHKIKPAGAMKMTCYIVTPPNPLSEFSIGFRDDRPPSSTNDDLLIECVVDGVLVKGEEMVIRAWKDGQQRIDLKKRTWTWRGRRESATVIRPFVFSPLQLTEDSDDACSSEQILRNLGTLQVRVYRGTVGGNSEEERERKEEEYRRGVEQLRGLKFEESSAKVKGGGVSHQAGLGEARLQHSTPRSNFDMSPLDSATKPYVVFEFVYRSRDVLELQGILEPLPEPAVVAGPSGSRGHSYASSTPAASNVDRQGSVKTDRSDSPALIMANRQAQPPLQPRASTAIKEDVKDEGNGEVEVMVIDDDSDDSDFEETRKKKITKVTSSPVVIKTASPTVSRPFSDKKKKDDRGKGKPLVGHQSSLLSSGSSSIDSSTSTPVPSLPIASSFTSTSTSLPSTSSTSPSKKSNTPSKKRSSPLNATDSTTPKKKQEKAETPEEIEIRTLKAEIAALKRKTELAELRRERDELEKRAREVEGRKEDVEMSIEEKQKKRAIRAEADSGRKEDDEVDESEKEEKEVVGLLTGGKGKTPTKNEAGTERENKKVKKSSDGAKEKDWEEMVLSDSNE